jgi:O-antigen/teichoic acid export membrane protein
MHVSLITADYISRIGTKDSSGGAGDAFSRVARRAAGGAFWVLVAFGAGKLLGFGTNIVLARLLTPAAFGLVSFAMILIGAFLLLQDLGVGPALVYSRRDIATSGGTALTLNLAAAFGLFLITAAGAAIYAFFGQRQMIAGVVVCLAFGLVITAAGSVQAALLTKELAFRKKLIPDVAPLAISGIVSIALAVMGAGVWSLVAGYLAKNLATTLLLWALSPLRPWPSFDRAIARELLGYGRHVSLSAVSGFAVMNVDYFVVGRALGAGPLGLYTLAFMIGTLPSTLISQQIATATFPAYARLRHAPADLARLFGNSFTISTTLAVALGAAVFVGAPTIVGPVLGEKWLGIVEPLRILAIFGVLRAVEFTFSPLYRAIGRPEIMWISSAIRLIALFPLLSLAVNYGIDSVAVVQVIVVALFIPLNGAILAYLLDLSLGTLAKLIVPQLLGTAALGAIVAMGYTNPTLATHIHNPLGATLIVGVGIMVQLAIVGVLSPALTAPLRVRVARVIGWRGEVSLR